MSAIQARIQAEALARWELAGKRGLLAMGTGSGKTKVALDRVDKLATLHGPNLRVLIAVPTTKLRDEGWPDEFAKWKMTHRLQQCSIDLVCYASLPTQPRGHYHLVVLDEAHRSTEYNAQVFEHITYDELLALSATPPTDPTKKALLDALAPTVFTYSIDDGVKDGVVADYDVEVILIPPDASTKSISAGSKKKPFRTTEAKHYKYMSDKLVEPLQIKTRELKKELQQAQFVASATGDYSDAEKLEKDLSKLEGRLRQAILHRTRFVYNLKSKEDAARLVLRQIVKPGKRTLVFAGSIAQAEGLCKWAYHSKTTDAWLTKFKAEEIQTLAVVNALNEGHNVPNLDQAVIVQLSSNERDLVQRIGRVIRFRPNHKAKVIILVSSGTVDETWASKALGVIHPSRVTYTTLEAWLAAQKAVTLTPPNS